MSSAAPPINCPKCQVPLQVGVNFCGNCGSLISGVWGSRTEMFGSTVAVQVTASADVLAEMLTSATIGDYDIYGELGRGGMAAVYLALDLSLNRKVALKTMLPELVVKSDMVERFKREAQTAAGLNHPHIIQIHAVKQTKELVYFVMKFIEGRSLESIITEQGPLSVPMAQVILNQVASALAYAHRKGVVHRDVKPANIMLDEDGWAIVTDFGIAKVQVAQNLTATGTAIGTPAYMSPEQFHNKSITGKSDQYSLGVVAHELLLGKKPFDGATYAEIITQHLFEPVPDLRVQRPDLPENVASSVMRMLAKKPDERFADLDAAAVALGSPDKAESDRLRGEMISLAKGARRTVRMSVPVSPIPMTKKPADPTVPASAASSAATAVVRKGAGPIAATVPERPIAKRGAARAPVSSGGGKARLWGGIAAAAVLVVGAFGTWRAMNGDAPPPPAPSVATAPVPVNEPPKTEPTATLAASDPGAKSTQPRAGDAGGGDTKAGNAAAASKTRDTKRQTSTAPQRTTPTPTKQAPPAAQGGLATLRLILSPPAQVFVDGSDKGQQTRLVDELVPGTHTLRIQREGYVTKDTIITLAVGQIATLRIQLTERP